MARVKSMVQTLVRQRRKEEAARESSLAKQTTELRLLESEAIPKHIEYFSRMIPPALREDYRQDMWVQLLPLDLIGGYLRLPGPKGRCYFVSYIGTVVRSRSLNWLRTKRRRIDPLCVWDPHDDLFEKATPFGTGSREEAAHEGDERMVRRHVAQEFCRRFPAVAERFVDGKHEGNHPAHEARILARFLEKCRSDEPRFDRELGRL